LGQHFVADPNIIEQTVKLADVQPKENVVEVGPGLGALTLGLANAGAHVVAIETDRSLEPALAEVLGEYLQSGQVRLVWQDVMEVCWETLLRPGTPTAPVAPTAAVAQPVPTRHTAPDPCPDSDSRPAWKLVANLPYNIATGLILEILEHVPAIQEITAMVQLEVAERLVADPNNSSYGIPSVKLAYWGQARMLRTIPASVFFPPPKINSAIVRISRHEAERPIGHKELFPLVERAFRQRRKMLRNSLQGVVSGEAFQQAGIAETDRPATLDLKAWMRLAAACRQATQT